MTTEIQLEDNVRRNYVKSKLFQRKLLHQIQSTMSFDGFYSDYKSFLMTNESNINLNIYYLSVSHLRLWVSFHP